MYEVVYCLSTGERHKVVVEGMGVKDIHKEIKETFKGKVVSIARIMQVSKGKKK